MYMTLCFFFIGLVTNGEFNTFRTKGNTRPVSVFAIKSAARSKYSSMGKKKMLAMLTPKGWLAACTNDTRTCNYCVPLVQS